MTDHTGTLQNGFCFDDAVFTYFLSRQKNDLFEKQQVFFSDKLVISHTKNTVVLTHQIGDESVCILGLCIDSHGELAREAIPEYLLHHGHGDIQVFLGIHRRFAGKYVVVYENRHGLYAFTDATGELQISYFTGGGICLSSVDELVAKDNHLQVSAQALDIRNGSNYNQPMPYTRTLYDDVKVLLPNHYLDLHTNAVRRYFPDRPITRQSLGSAVERTIFLVRNIVQEYARYYNLADALSAGWDSRCNLAFLKDLLPNIPCFTHNHAYFTPETADCYIPPMICKQQGLPHALFDDLEPPKDVLEGLQAVIGPYHGKELVSFGYSFSQNMPGEAVINGDIIGTIANDLLGQNLPNIVATPQYFLTKLHNYSKHTKAIVREHIAEIKGSRFGAPSVIDLFALESRCGRWQAQTHMIYSVLGLISLNLFNCQELLALWIGVSRKERTHMAIHKAIFQTLNPSLMEIPFNPGRKQSIAYANPLFFLLATHSKYLLDRRKPR